MADKKTIIDRVQVKTFESFDEDIKSGAASMEGEDEMIDVSIDYEVPVSVVDRIMDKVKEEAEEDAEGLDEESVAKRAIMSVLDKFLDADNIEVADILVDEMDDSDDEDEDEDDEDDDEDEDLGGEGDLDLDGDLDLEEEGSDAEMDSYGGMPYESKSYKLPSIQEFMSSDYHNIYKSKPGVEDAPKYGKHKGMDKPTDSFKDNQTDYHTTMNKDTEHKYGGKISQNLDPHKSGAAKTGYEKTRDKDTKHKYGGKTSDENKEFSKNGTDYETKLESRKYRRNKYRRARRRK